jgi:hypothetical protein
MRLTPFEREQLLPRIAECHTPDEVKAIRDMKIELKCPPNFETIKKVFPYAEKAGILFAYGNTIFNPSGVTIPIYLVAHECTHALQQRQIGGPEEWWRRYLEDEEFVISQELDAHRIEYREFCQTHNRAERHRALRTIALKLSGPLYNHGIKKKLAQKLLELELEEA